ncbi:MAG: hypothetical protein HYW07_14155 [Candidatus Latescibacteria bacterium]|nr:hypothetical protein [Candidatus Latescibacterota bacterium]
MKEGDELAAQIHLDAELLAQVKACLEETGFATVEAFVHFCVENEKELKVRRDAEEKALAERLRGLGYLE